MNQSPSCLLLVNLLPQKIVYSHLIRPWTHEEFKEAMHAILSDIQEHDLENWLIDTNATNFTLQDQKWASEHLGLLLQSTKIKKVALVRYHDAMLQIVAESMRAKIYRIFGSHKILEHFDSRIEALRFLAPDDDPEFLNSVISEEESKGSCTRLEKEGGDGVSDPDN